MECECKSDAGAGSEARIRAVDGSRKRRAGAAEVKFGKRRDSHRVMIVPLRIGDIRRWRATILLRLALRWSSRNSLATLDIVCLATSVDVMTQHVEKLRQDGRSIHRRQHQIVTGIRIWARQFKARASGWNCGNAIKRVGIKLDYAGGGENRFGGISTEGRECGRLQAMAKGKRGECVMK